MTTAALPSDQGLRALVEAHGGVLRAYLVRRTGDRHRADDLAQEVLLRAWRRADTFDPGRGEVRGWLLAIARNVVIDAARADAARPRTAADPARLAAVPAPDALHDAVEAWTMEQALQQLSPPHRTVLEQLYFRRLSTTEAAAESGVPVGTVKSRSTYALRALRTVLEAAGVAVVALASVAYAVQHHDGTAPPVVAAGVSAEPGVTASAGYVEHPWGLEIRLDASGLAAGSYALDVVDRAGHESAAGTFVGTGRAVHPSVRTDVHATSFVVRDSHGQAVVRGTL